MKKYLHLLGIPIIILGLTFMIIAMRNNIASGISLTQEITNEVQSIAININTASTSDLKNIPGIGDSLAKKIVAYRSENGPFHAVKDLMNVDGIGTEIFDRIAKYLTVGG